MSEYEPVRVWRSPAGRFMHDGYRYLSSRDEPGRWFPEAEAQALLDIQCAVAIGDIAMARVGYQRWCDARTTTGGLP